jgi:hypothetical protein
MNRFAVILTHDRPEHLRETWCAIGPQVDMVIIIDNASSPPVDFRDYHSGASEQGCDWVTAVVRDEQQPPNISRLWNLGIEMSLTAFGNGGWPGPGRPNLSTGPLVAVLCDDAPPPPGWFDAVATAMRETGAVVGCSAPTPFGFGGPPRVKTAPDSLVSERMPGWAWILDPVSPVRPDVRFEYWWGDTDLDLQARAAGGMVQIGDHPVPNRVPDGWTGRMAGQVAVDSQRFVDKYNGWRPW